MEQCKLKKELPQYICRDFGNVLCLGDIADCETMNHSENVMVYIDKYGFHYTFKIPKNVFYECFEEVKKEKVWDKERNKYMNSVVVNGKTFVYPEGSNIVIIKNDQVVVDGKVLAECDNNANVVINGNIENLKCRGSVTVNGDAEMISCGGSCNVSGCVGDINAGGSVSCGNVTGDIDAGGSVNCKNRRINK